MLHVIPALIWEKNKHTYFIDHYQQENAQALKDVLDGLCGWPSINPNWEKENPCTDGKFPCERCRLETILLRLGALDKFSLVDFRDTDQGFFVSYMLK